MNGLNIYYISLIILLNLSCKCNSQISRNLIGNKQTHKCENYFTISSNLEPDSKFREILSAYLYKFLIGGSECEILSDKNLKQLYLRNSFRKTILLFYTNKDLENLNVFEDKREWIDRYQELLYGVKDIGVLNEIANDLLAKNNFDGALALWEKADIKKLSNMTKYVNNVDSNNFYICAEISAFYHILNKPFLSEQYLKKASEIKGFEKEYGTLSKLLKDRKFFEYSEFKEMIYGTY